MAASIEPKPLHLATSLKELNSKVTTENLQKANPKSLCKSADKLFLAASDKIIECDQEHAYILLLRYLEVVKVIRASKEYKQSKKSFDALLDGLKIMRALENAENLSKQLERRYAEIDKTQEVEQDHNNSSDTIPSSNQSSLGTYVSPEQVYQLLTNSGDTTVVVDCRTRKDYTASHVDSKRYPQWLSVPEEVIESGNLTTFMSSNNRKLWEERGLRSNIVLIDEKSNQENSDRQQPILLLKKKLEEEGLTVHILEGGYNMWYMTYSPLCVGKWKDKDLQKPITNIERREDELSYPTLPSSNVEGHQVQGNLVTKSPHNPPLLTPETNAPTVNRLTKPTNKQLSPSPKSQIKFSNQSEQTIDTDRLSIQLNEHAATNHIGPVTSQPVPPTNILPTTHPLPPPTSHAVAADPSPLSQLMQHHTGHPVFLNTTGYPMQAPTSLLVPPSGPTTSPVPPNGLPINHPVQPPTSQSALTNSPSTVHQLHSNVPFNAQPTGHNYQLHINNPSTNDSHLMHPSGHLTDYPIGQSGYPTGQVIQPSDYTTGVHQSRNDQYTTHTTTTTEQHVSNPVPFAILPPAPSVNLPLDLEGRGALMSQDMISDFMEDWYPSDNMYNSNSSSEEMYWGVDNTQPSAYSSNPRQVFGPLPVPPSYQDAQYLPSHSPVQPPLPPPVSVLIEEDTVIDDNTLEKKNTEEKISQMEEVRIMMQKQLELERARMKEELKEEFKEEHEKVKAAFDEKIREQEIEFKRQVQELEQTLREDYEKEKTAILKNNEEMKHYWESIQLENKHQRQMVINQGLPTGWEKRLDRTTGRFYYIDHNTHSTHWNPPTSLLQYQQHFAGQSNPALEASKLPAGPGQPIPQYLSGHCGSSEHVQQPLPQVPPSYPILQSNVPQSSNGQTILSPNSSHSIPSTSGTSPQPQPNKGQPVPSQPAKGQPTTLSHSSQPTTTGQPSSNQSSHGTSTSAPSANHHPVVTPHIDRANKPKAVQPMPAEVYRQKILNLQPVQGGRGPGLTGLRNLGNTCFMSSVIQCLCSTPNIVQYFYSNKYRVDLNRSNPLGTGGVLAEEFYILVVAMWLGKFRYISPQGFKNVVSQFASYFAGNQQHDCQEFLVYLLDGLHEDLNKILVKSYIEMPDTDGVSDTTGAQQAWVAHKKRNASVIVDLFHGLLKSTITCLTCGKQKVMFEPFVSLSVPIPQGRSSCSYHDCLKLFTAREYMTGSNKWFCPKCKTPRDSEKTLHIWSLPPVLLLHFKRFQDKGNVREKMATHISFPLESLDLNPYIVGPKPTKEYNLYAISNHTGNLQSGHYTATCKNPHNQKFYYFDDHEIREASSKDLNTTSAYLLFYTCENIKI